MTPFEPIPAQELLPQQPPFRFVDALVHFDETSARTRFRVPADTPLVVEGLFLSTGLLEHMAQSSAARVGYISRYLLHEPVRIGYLGQIKNYRVTRFPRVGETLETTVVLVLEMGGINLSDITVRCGDEVLATAQLKTALKEDE